MENNLDGYIDFSGAVNQAVNSDKVADNQLSGAVNCSFVNGLRPRDKFKTVELSVITEGERVTRDQFRQSYSDIFAQGKFQGCWEYENSSTLAFIAIVSGLIFKIDLLSCEVVLLSETITLDEYQDAYNATQGSDYFYIHNFPERTVIIDLDDTVRYANKNNTISISDNEVTAPEVPPSSVGHFDDLRLVIGKDWNEYLFSDPAVSDFDNGESTFSEVFQGASSRFGQVFSVPGTSSRLPISFLGSILVPDTSTGIGGLIVSNKKRIIAAASQNLPTEQLVPGFTTLLVKDHGIAGPRAATNLGFDFLYISTENQVRSLNTSRNQQGQWSNPSLSEEVKEYLKSTQDLMHLATVEYHKSKVFFNCNPYRVKAKDSKGRDVFDYAFKALLVMENNIVSSMNGSSPPGWAGIWQQNLLGFRDIIRVDNRLFVWAKTERGNKLVEIVEGKVDELFGVKYKVKSRVYTRALGAKAFLTDKELQKITGELTRFDLKLGLKIQGYYRPFHGQKFIKVGSAEFSVKDSLQCAYNVQDSGLKEFVLGRSKHISECDEGTGAGYQNWRKAEILLELTGDWELNSLFVKYKETVVNSLATNTCDYAADKVSSIDCDFASDFNIKGESNGNCQK